MKNSGKIKELVLDRSVIKPILQNRLGIEKGASVGADCALFDGIGISTGYVALDYEQSVRLAIAQACNNLWASMVRPEKIQLVISLPENYREIKIKAIMNQAAESAKDMSLKIVGGHTEYVPGLKYPVIAVTGYGKQIREEKLHAEKYDIVMTKWMGISGTSIIATQKEEELIKRLPISYVRAAAKMGQLIEVAPEAEIAIGDNNVVAMHDVAGGGIFTALWELGAKLECGLKVDLRSIPVMQETIEVCEYYDINPYRLRSDGSLLIATANGEALSEAIREAGINAVVIGQTMADSNDRIVYRDEENRYLESGNGDEIYSVMW